MLQEEGSRTSVQTNPCTECFFVMFLLVFPPSVPRIEHRSWHMLGKHSTTELYPSPCFYLFFKDELRTQRESGCCVERGGGVSLGFGERCLFSIFSISFANRFWKRAEPQPMSGGESMLNSIVHLIGNSLSRVSGKNLP